MFNIENIFSLGLSSLLLVAVFAIHAAYYTIRNYRKNYKTLGYGAMLVSLSIMVSGFFNV